MKKTIITTALTLSIASALVAGNSVFTAFALTDDLPNIEGKVIENQSSTVDTSNTIDTSYIHYNGRFNGEEVAKMAIDAIAEKYGEVMEDMHCTVTIGDFLIYNADTDEIEEMNSVWTAMFTPNYIFNDVYNGVNQDFSNTSIAETDEEIINNILSVTEAYDRYMVNIEDITGDIQHVQKITIDPNDDSPKG